MTYFPDLTPCTYFDFEGKEGGLPPEQVLAVGWLGAGHSFPQGVMAPDLLTRLADLAQSPWQPWMSMGAHRCEVCSPTPPPGMHPEAGFGIEMTIGGRHRWVGADNLFVPGSGVIYLVPNMVLHYIQAHNYLPPEPFLVALRKCPAMRTPDGRHWNRRYRALIEANGPAILKEPELWEPPETAFLGPGPLPKGLGSAVAGLWRRLLGR